MRRRANSSLIGALVIANESDEKESFDALYAGASATLPRSAEGAEIATAIDVARRGLALLPRHVLERLLDASSPASEESLRDDGASRVSLTPREPRCSPPWPMAPPIRQSRGG
jgi:DNA-binding NarL/FixJ family response regulator